MTFLIKIQLLNWQQNVYQCTSCPQNWASVFTSYTNKLQSQVAITFKKHKLATKKYYKLSTLITHRWLEADASRPRPELLEATAKATILGPRAVLELEDSPRGPTPSLSLTGSMESRVGPRARGQSSRTPSLSLTGSTERSSSSRTVLEDRPHPCL